MKKIISKKILLGICAGIAAYKSAELVRLLRKQPVEVRVVMTLSATQFVTPLTFQALSGNPVHSQLFAVNEDNVMEHITLARWADLLIIAPATANMIAKISHGLADDFLSTLCLAADCPVHIAPAMNQAMWRKTVTQDNIKRLQENGVNIIGPETGEQACGEFGYGRMSAPEKICNELLSAENNALLGLKVLVSAGPTREALDPVRYISNRSSGKMGYAIAQAAVNSGAEVTLVSGPVNLVPPASTQLINVESAQQMYDAIVPIAGKHDIYIGAAAVADYRPLHIKKQKIKKQDEDNVISLQRNKDIIAAVSQLKNKPFVVGFAAETHDIESYAQKKMRDKNMDMIAANLVGQQQGGFDSDTNSLEVFWKQGRKSLLMIDKKRLAEQLIALIAQKFDEKNST